MANNAEKWKTLTTSASQPGASTGIGVIGAAGSIREPSVLDDDDGVIGDERPDRDDWINPADLAAAASEV